MVSALQQVNRKKLSEILAEVSLETGVSVDDLKSTSKRALFVKARSFFALRAREYGYALIDIGEAIDRAHTTILALLKMSTPDPEGSTLPVQKGERQMDKAELKKRIANLTKEERRELVQTIAEEGTKEDRDNLAALFSGAERGLLGDASKDAARGGSPEAVRTAPAKEASFLDDL